MAGAREAADAGREAVPWSIWIDTGGTFTDCVAVAPGGATERLKVLSSAALRGVVERIDDPTAPRVAWSLGLPADFLAGQSLHPVGGGWEPAPIRGSSRDGELRLEAPLGARRGDACEVRFDCEAPVLAAHLATATRPGEPLPPVRLRLATTRATNALLERSGARTALFVTRGFADLLRIGTQQRPDLFALEVRLEAPLHAVVVEVDERIDADGRCVRPLDEAALEAALAGLAPGPEDAAALVLLHSYRRAEHELAVELLLRRAGWRFVSRSSAVAPLQGAVARAQTTLVDAYLAPSVDTYLRRVAAALGEGERSLRVMTSSGGLQAASDVRPKDTLLSGPAGGVVGAVRAAGLCGERRLISFDMGGTSTDVARYDDEFDYRFVTEVAGARVLAPALAVETVAAGGGSICGFDGYRLRVGPRSAGAVPGPACYGAGGPLALTDVNLLLGRLDPERFEIPLAPAAAAVRLRELTVELARHGQEAPPEVLLEGLLQIANERMAEAIRRISVRRGYDPADYALLAFGGAGGQHACAVASQLGMRRIVVPADASVLSAWGLGQAVIERIVERQVLAPLEEFAPGAERRLAELVEEGARQLRAEGVAAAEIVVRRTILLLRLAGQDATLAVDHAPATPIHDAFQRAYRERYGYDPPRRGVEVESLRIVVSSAPPLLPPEAPAAPGLASPGGRRSCHIGGAWVDVPVYPRHQLPAGGRFTGPALVVERYGAVVVEEGWSARVGAGGSLTLGRGEAEA